jgi:hydroxymethylbilane synthase
LLHARPDLDITEIRGNVETRVRKLDDGEFDAIVLAEAGLERLELADRIAFRLAPPSVLPAVGQGALGLECRVDDERTCSILSEISHSPTRAEALAERACLRALRAGCHAPVGALSEVASDGERLSLQAAVLSHDGKIRIAAEASGSTSDPEAVGVEAAEELFRGGAEKLLRS